MMCQAIAFMLLTGVLWTLVGIVYGKAPDEKGRLYSFLTVNGVFYSIFIWGTRFPQTAPVPEVLRLAAYMIPAAATEMIGFLLLKFAMERGNQGIAWSIAQSAMIIPFLGAILFLHNQAGAVKYAGAAILLLGLVLAGMKQSGQTDRKLGGGVPGKGFLFFSFGAFLLVGIAQFMRIIPGNAGFSEAALSWRLPVSAPLPVMIWGSVTLVRRAFVPGKVWKISAVYAVVTALGQICFFRAVDAADPLGITSIVYPVAVGTSIFLFSFYCLAVRKEKFPLPACAGLCCIAAGIVMLSSG